MRGRPRRHALGLLVLLVVSASTASGRRRRPTYSPWRRAAPRQGNRPGVATRGRAHSKASLLDRDERPTHRDRLDAHGPPARFAPRSGRSWPQGVARSDYSRPRAAGRPSGAAGRLRAVALPLGWGLRCWSSTATRHFRASRPRDAGLLSALVALMTAESGTALASPWDCAPLACRRIPGSPGRPASGAASRTSPRSSGPVVPASAAARDSRSSGWIWRHDSGAARCCAGAQTGCGTAARPQADQLCRRRPAGWVAVEPRRLPADLGAPSRG